MSRVIIKGGKYFSKEEGAFLDNEFIVLENGLIHFPKRAAKEKLEDVCVSAEGKFIAPGLIDAHTHFEPSMLSPYEYFFNALRFGTTTLILDAHDTANALGAKSLLSLKESFTPFNANVKLMLALCVPPSRGREDAYELFTLANTKELMEDGGFFGVSELMDVQGILSENKDILEMIDAAKEHFTLFDGHIPSLSKEDFEKYIKRTNAHSDHEITSLSDFKMKVHAGLNVFVRYPVNDFTPSLDDFYNNDGNLCENLIFCTDGLTPITFLKEGHLNLALKNACEKGLSPYEAIMLASASPAKAYGLNDRGDVKEGMRADLVIFDDLKDFKPYKVFLNSEAIDVPSLQNKHPFKRKNLFASVFNAPKLKVDDVKNALPSSGLMRLIKLPNDSLLTDEGEFHYDKNASLPKGVHFAIVSNRYAYSCDFSLAFVFLEKDVNAAFMGTVAQDTGNVCGFSKTLPALITAYNDLYERKGGLVLASEESVLNRVSLEYAGIASFKSFLEFEKEIENFSYACSKRGIDFDLAFHRITLQIPLSVFPKLKLTNRGLYSYKANDFVSLKK